MNEIIRIMSFTEQNSIENFVIHQLTGVNLNEVQNNLVSEELVDYGSVRWRYVQPEILQRELTDVLLEKELKESLCRINPDIASQPEQSRRGYS